MASAADAPPAARAAPWIEHLPLLVGLALLAVPTMVTLGREVWTREIGAHGPIVLATGLWMLVNQRRAMLAQAAPAPFALVAALAAPALALYVFGRAYDFISLEAAGLYGVMLAFALRLLGVRGMAAAWFPFFYFAFLVPPPGWVIDQATAPLQTFVSYVCTGGLAALGFPIAREGVTMTIAQYQLLVEDACSGMNSIIGLTAISLLYIYLMHRASWRYALLLVAFILPIAVLTNIVRVTVLVLLTYYAGDAVAQGFLHVTAGFVLFLGALLLIFGLDALLGRLMGRPAA